MLVACLLAAGAPVFDPLRFFAGRTRGEGRLKVVLRSAVAVSVRGRGTPQPDGSLVLEQRIVEGAKPPRTRHWRLREVSPGRYTGTLSDARGPVTDIVRGRSLRLAYATPGGFRIRQWLTLAPDGQSADNWLEARRFGIKVAGLHETITRAD